MLWVNEEPDLAMVWQIDLTAGVVEHILQRNDGNRLLLGVVQTAWGEESHGSVSH